MGRLESTEGTKNKGEQSSRGQCTKRCCSCKYLKLTITKDSLVSAYIFHTGRKNKEMEWLRCNKCYREMKKTKRTFSLTQCGHLYCSRCLADVTAKCAVCGTQDFKTMTLGNPPKPEMQNFFTPTDEYIELGMKIEMFQNNQLYAVARGFEETEKKYENMKKVYWNTMKEMDLLAQAYQKLEVKTAKLEAFRNSLLKAREVENVNVESRGSSPLRYAQGHQNQRNSGNTQNYPATHSFAEKTQLRTPEQAYDPRTPRYSRGTDSESYGTDSGLSSIPGSSSNRTGVFRVPSAQKVPKSAATVKKRTPTS